MDLKIGSQSDRGASLGQRRQWHGHGSWHARGVAKVFQHHLPLTQRSPRFQSEALPGSARLPRRKHGLGVGVLHPTIHHQSRGEIEGKIKLTLQDTLGSQTTQKSRVQWPGVGRHKVGSRNGFGAHLAVDTCFHRMVGRSEEHGLPGWRRSIDAQAFVQHHIPRFRHGPHFHTRRIQPAGFLHRFCKLQSHRFSSGRIPRQQEAFVGSRGGGDIWGQEIAHAADTQNITDEFVGRPVVHEDHRARAHLPLRLRDLVHSCGKLRFGLVHPVRPVDRHKIDGFRTGQTNRKWFKSSSGERTGRGIFQDRPATLLANTKSSAKTLGVRAHRIARIDFAGQLH